MQTVGTFGSAGAAPGQFQTLHHLAVDSKGNIYRAQTNRGLQKLMFKGMAPASRVVPGVTGTVLLEWQFPDGTYGEVEIVRPFYAEVMMIQPGRPPKHWTLPTDG